MKPIVTTAAVVGVALTAVVAFGSDTHESVRPSVAFASYEYSAEALRVAVADPELSHFELQLDWGSTDIMQGALIAVNSNQEISGIFVPTFVDRDLDIEAMEGMPAVSQEIRGAQPATVSAHIIDPAVAAGFIADWDFLVESGESLKSALQIDNTSIHGFTIEKTSITNIVRRADASKLGVFWGLNDEGRVTPVLLAINGGNHVDLGEESEHEFLMDVTLGNVYPRCKLDIRPCQDKIEGLNQVLETSSGLNSFIKPSESRGYICWNEFEGADQYLIRVHEADEEGVLSVIREEFTTKNYHSLGHEYLTDTSKSYSISAYRNGEMIEEGDRTPFASDALITEECRKKCNGKTYAYQISYLTYDNAPASVNDRLVVNPTNNLVDTASGIATPFYQAVSMAQHDIMVATGHPYAQINGYTANGPNWVYKHVPIISNCSSVGGVAVGSPYTDADGNPVCDGYLIEKKMDQFSYMAGNSTSADPGINICDPTIPITWGMMPYYNAYQNPMNPAYIPADGLPFTAVTPASLECNGSGGYSGPGGGSGFTPVEDWPNGFVNCIFVAVINGSYTVPAILEPCFEQLISPGSGVTGLLFEPLDQAIASVIVTNDRGYYAVEGELAVGLYNMHIFTDAGGVLSTVGEVTEDDRGSFQRE